MESVVFDEDQIRLLFGDEAAESENIDRLKQYYIKTSFHKQFTSNAPLRILVGHKGIGKSALMRIAKAENDEDSILSIFVKPDDISDIGEDVTDFLKLIKSWKTGLKDLLAKEAFGKLCDKAPKFSNKLKRYAGDLLAFIYDNISSDNTGISIDETKRRLIESFNQQRIMNVYIDDLDRGWQGRKTDIQRISALLNAARDISAENTGVRFRISLRADVYFLVRTSDESTDKIEGSVLWQSWTNHEIFILLLKRIATFFGETLNDEWIHQMRQSDLEHYLNRVIEPTFQGRGKWENAPMRKVILSLIRKRPRDLVKLCTLAAREANKDSSHIMQTKHFEDIFKQYSQGRIQDTVNEYRFELPEIERLILNMKQNKSERKTSQSNTYTTDQIITKIKNLEEQGAFTFADGRRATAKQLLAFLYKINFLTARKTTEIKTIRYYFEENRYLSNELADFGYNWEVHPAYRWALQPDDMMEIFSTLELSE